MKILVPILFTILLAFACSPEKDDLPTPAFSSADSLFQLATRQLDSLKYQTALENFRSAEPLFLQAENWEKTIACRRSQATCLWWSHRSPEAVALCEQTLPEAKQRLGESHLEIAKLCTILGNVHADKRTEKDFRLCLDYFQKALDATRLHYGDAHPALAEAYDRLGVARFLVDDYVGALPFHEKSLTFLKPPTPDNAVVYYRIYNHLGVSYRGMGWYQKALESFEKSFHMIAEVQKKRNGRTVNALLEVARIRLLLGDFDEALLTYEEALALQKQVGEPGSKFEAYLLSGIGDCWKAAGDFAKARSFYEQCLPFWTTGKRDDVHGLQVELQNLGECCLLQNDPAAALRYFQQAWQTIDSVYDVENYSRVSPLVNLGKAHALRGNAAATLEAWHNALSIARKNVGARHPVTGQIRQLIAGLHFKNGNLGAARQAAAQALQSIAGWGVNEIPITQPGEFRSPTLSNVSDLPVCMDLLSLLGDLSQNWNLSPWLADSPTGEKVISLRRSLGFYKCSLALSDSLKISLTSQPARQEVQKKVAVLSEKAIGCAHRLHTLTGDSAWIADAFVFFEKSKSALLAASLREEQAATGAGIPAEMLRQEQWLKSQCAYLRQRWQNPDPAAAVALPPGNWQAQYFQARRQLDSLVGSLEKNYPDYFRRKYDASVASLAEVQRQANAENAAVLEFFWGDSSVYLLAVSPDQTRLTRIGAPSELENLLVVLRKSLHDYQPGLLRPDVLVRQEFQAFCEAALALHDRLFRDTPSHLSKPPLSSWKDPSSLEKRSGDGSFQDDKSGKNSSAQLRLVIVPDGMLNYLPFAALLERQPETEVIARLDWRRLPYLVRSHAIQLVPSATLWLENDAAPSGGSYLGFAPAYKNEKLLAVAASRSDSLRLERGWGDAAREALPPLHFNHREVELASSLAGGKIFPGEKATEENFKKNAAEAGILHCAMHALTSDANPQHAALVFSQNPGGSEDGRLHAWEICNLRLRADLAVLSACNTGAGQLLQGEGVMSLAHAFQFAGCRSVMMSLWRANDAATKDVTVGFFEHLSAGERKSEALRQSVLAFLSEVKNDEQAHPSCWANFVVSGSDAPVVLNSKKAGTVWWVLALLLLGGGFFYFRKRRV